MPYMNMLIKPVSGSCNMRCKYCFYTDVMNNREVARYGKMSEDTLETLVKKAFEYEERQITFGFQGGEPTLIGIDFYKRLIKLQKKYNVKNVRVFNSIQTNGYDLNDEWAEFFCENDFLVGVSLDGTREAHDSLRVSADGPTYDRVLKTIKLFQKHNVQYNILCVVNNFVARYPKKIFQALAQHKFLQFIPCLDSFDGERSSFSLDKSRFLHFLRCTFDEYYKCAVSGNYVSVRNFDNYVGILMGKPPENCAMNGICSAYFLVESDGSVYPCDFYVLDRWKMGNISDMSFKELIESEQAQEFVSESRYIDPKCRGCKWFALCRGGCKREREPFIDGHPNLNRFCECYIEFFEYAYPRMVELARLAARGAL